MSFDRSTTSAADEHHDLEHPRDHPADRAHDGPGVRSLTEVSATQDVSRRPPTEQERTEAHHQARLAAAKAYAAWGQPEGRDKNGTAPDVDGPQHRETAGLGSKSSDHAPSEQAATTETAEIPSATEEALRRRVSDLEADKAARDRQLDAQDKQLAVQADTIAGQDKRIVRLEADLGLIAKSVTELRQKQEEARPSDSIAARAGGGEVEQAEWTEQQRKRRLPTDAVNNVIALVAGGTITTAAYYVRDVPAEYAGIGASGLAIGAGIIAVVRERRKAKEDADHRPQG